MEEGLTRKMVRVMRERRETTPKAGSGNGGDGGERPGGQVGEGEGEVDGQGEDAAPRRVVLTATAMGSLCSVGLIGRRGSGNFNADEGEEKLGMIAVEVYKSPTVTRKYRTQRRDRLNDYKYIKQPRIATYPYEASSIRRSSHDVCPIRSLVCIIAFRSRRIRTLQIVVLCLPADFSLCGDSQA